MRWRGRLETLVLLASTPRQAFMTPLPYNLMTSTGGTVLQPHDSLSSVAQLRDVQLLPNPEIGGRAAFRICGPTRDG